MNYRLMRLKKYRDSILANKTFFTAPLKDKFAILLNVLKFFKNSPNKPLIINNNPVTAQIEPTSLCNLRCRMCVREKEGVPIGSMSFEEFKIILDKLKGLYKVGISGQGELFLNKDIFKMINYANKRGKLVHVVSNGMLINDEIIQKICEVDIGEIAVSIDSTKKEKYEKIRVRSNFNQVTGNIKNLVEELNKKKKKTIVSIATIIFKDNINEIPDFVLLAKKLGVKKIAFQTLQTKENYVKDYDKEMRNQTVENDVDWLRDKIEEGKEIAKREGITLIFDEIKRPGCIWPWRGIYINWKGDVTVCCKVFDYKNPLLGNLLKQDLNEIWNGPNYQRYREFLKKRKVPFESCKGCNEI
jgi:radical SAM protein with 4Fe4S-binding SPASM domain